MVLKDLILKKNPLRNNVRKKLGWEIWLCHANLFCLNLVYSIQTIQHGFSLWYQYLLTHYGSDYLFHLALSSLVFTTSFNHGLKIQNSFVVSSWWWKTSLHSYVENYWQGDPSNVWRMLWRKKFLAMQSRLTNWVQPGGAAWVEGLCSHCWSCCNL